MTSLQERSIRRVEQLVAEARELVLSIGVEETNTKEPKLLSISEKGTPGNIIWNKLLEAEQWLQDIA